MLNYIFGGKTGISSPQELARRREQQRTMQARSAGRMPQDPWEGLSAIASAIGGRVEKNRLDEAESRGKATGESAYAPIAQALAGKGTPDIGTLTGALSNDWLNPGQRSIAQWFLKQSLDANDPMSVLDRRYKGAQINNLQNPRLTPYQREQLAVERQRIAQGGAGSAEPGLNPQYGVNGSGDPGLVRSGRSDQAVQAEGAVRGKAVATPLGGYQAGQNALDLVESIRTDPYKERGTGYSSLGNVIPGTGGYDFQNKVDQAKSGAFVTAIQQLLDLGTLSSEEGNAASEAVARILTSTSKREFDSALSSYEGIVRQGMTRSTKNMPAPTTTPPPQGRVEDPLGIR